MGKALIFNGVQIDSPLQTVTLIQTELINPTLSISSDNEETDTTFSFTISAENAIKVCYMVKESSEAAPSDIFSDGQSITISELPKKITVSGKSPETTYKIYAGAMSSDNVKVEKNISITTKEKVLTTADDYVDEYAKLATEVTSEQKGYLKTFVGTLIDNGIWDKVRCCFPMLGGLSGYNKDLKDIRNQRIWNTPENGTSWDSTRNAPLLYLPGFAIGTPLVIDDMDKNSSSFLFSTKLKGDSRGALIEVEYAYRTGMYDKYIVNSTLNGNTGGYQSPRWGTETPQESLSGYFGKANASNIYILTMNKGTNSLFVCSNNDTILTGGTGSTNNNETTTASFAFGSYYGGEAEAPATNTLNGTMNMFIAFNSALTEEELEVVSRAVWTFDESCGRHIDFE